MTPIKSAVPHLDRAELTLIAKGELGAAIDPRISSHLENCDECLLLLADCIHEQTPEAVLRQAEAPGLRALNLAAARWRSEVSKTNGEPETAPSHFANLESPEARLELLLGQAAGPAQTQSPLLALFVGKRQART